MEQVHFTSTSAVARDSCVSNRGNCHSLREHDQQNGLLQKSEKIHSVKNDLMTLTYMFQSKLFHFQYRVVTSLCFFINLLDQQLPYFDTKNCVYSSVSHSCMNNIISQLYSLMLFDICTCITNLGVNSLFQHLLVKTNLSHTLTYRRSEKFSCFNFCHQLWCTNSAH